MRAWLRQAEIPMQQTKEDVWTLQEGWDKANSSTLMLFITYLVASNIHVSFRTKIVYLAAISLQGAAQALQ